ncbi:MAG: hypothetical protein PIR02_15865 [Microbacterium enclense]
MTVQPHLLFSERWDQTITADGSDGISTLIPANGFRCSDSHLLVFSGRYTGTKTPQPTTVEWALVPQILIPHTSGYQFSMPGWQSVKPSYLGIQATGATVDEAGGRVVMSSSVNGTLSFDIRVDVSKIDGFQWLSVVTATGTNPARIGRSLTMSEHF